MHPICHPMIASDEYVHIPITWEKWILILIQYQDWCHRCITMTSHGCHTFSNHWQLDLVQQFVQANNKENIKAPYYRPFVTGPFVSIIHRWFVDSLTKSQSCGKYVCGMKSSYTLWFSMSNMFILHCYGTREFNYDSSSRIAQLDV